MRHRLANQTWTHSRGIIHKFQIWRQSSKSTHWQGWTWGWNTFQAQNGLHGFLTHALVVGVVLKLIWYFDLKNTTMQTFDEKSSNRNFCTWKIQKTFSIDWSITTVFFLPEVRGMLKLWIVPILSNQNILAPDFQWCKVRVKTNLDQIQSKEIYFPKSSLKWHVKWLWPFLLIISRVISNRVPIG